MPTKNIADQIISEIRAEMARQKKSGTELGQVLGMSQRAASYRLNGQRAMGWDETFTTANWLGLTLAELVKRAEIALELPDRTELAA
ncbi:hypothetical protein [Paeniglutamicibacter terrestris]|uniref:Helix-turn-helix transcriptional regulator n=1 Tax=Paeniglutamicibacter terrestris TaxID=2723403 RepID=A0ABX1GA16_9MICC|nr:hypothetical protein [Paeniglutamicibacter terrestris]NKG22247.1 hypothetical protein [Paeniglutamicibacter terrestris]